MWCRRIPPNSASRRTRRAHGLELNSSRIEAPKRCLPGVARGPAVAQSTTTANLRPLPATPPTTTMKPSAPQHENGDRMNWPKPPIATNPFLPPSSPPTPAPDQDTPSPEAREEVIRRRLAVNAQQFQATQARLYRETQKLKKGRKACPQPEPQPQPQPQPTEPPPKPTGPRVVRVSQSVRTISAGLPTLGKRR